MEHEFEKRFLAKPKDKKLYEEVGEGVRATVYRALCNLLNKIVATKVLDLEKCNNNLSRYLVIWRNCIGTIAHGREVFQGDGSDLPGKGSKETPKLQKSFRGIPQEPVSLLVKGTERVACNLRDLDGALAYGDLQALEIWTAYEEQNKPEKRR